jgi:hypothetical protein
MSEYNSRATNQYLLALQYEKSAQDSSTAATGSKRSGHNSHTWCLSKIAAVELLSPRNDAKPTPQYVLLCAAVCYCNFIATQIVTSLCTQRQGLRIVVSCSV